MSEFWGTLGVAVLVAIVGAFAVFGLRRAATRVMLRLGFTPLRAGIVRAARRIPRLLSSRSRDIGVQAPLPGVKREVLRRHYEPLAVVEFYNPGRGAEPPAKIWEDAVECVLEWCESEGATAPVLLIGDLGAGKTTILTQIAIGCARRMGRLARRRIPVTVPLRSISADVLLDGCVHYLREHLKIEGLGAGDLRAAIRERDIVLLLDGLDEYVHSTGLSAFGVLDQVHELAGPRGLIVVASRPTIFQTSSELIEYARRRESGADGVSRRLAETREFRVLSLRPLTDQKIDSILRSYGDRGLAAMAYLRRAPRVHDLARQPLLLDLLVAAAEDDLPEDPSPGQIFDAYVTQCLTAERRQTQKSLEKSLAICEKLALRMNVAPHGALTADAIRACVDDESLMGVLSSLFLTPSGRNSWQFLHRTLMEFFVARALVRGIQTGDLEEVATREITYQESVLHFARDLLPERDRKHLADLLSDERRWVRFVAAHLMARLDVEGAIQQISARVDAEGDSLVLREFLIALAFLGDGQAGHRLVERLRANTTFSDENERLVVEYFGGESSAIRGAVARLSERADYPTREMLLWFLGHVGGRSEIPAIRPYGDDAQATVARVAREAVSLIHERSSVPGPLRAVLMDLDGVLLDSIDAHIAAWQDVWASRGVTDIRDEEVRESEGMKSREVATRMAEARGLVLSEWELDRLVDSKRRAMEQEGPVRLVEGARAFVDRVVRAGLPVVVVTGSVEARVAKARGLLAAGSIRGWVTAESACRGKPSPDPYVEALGICDDCGPTEALVIENAPLGVDSANRAGIYCAAITTTLGAEKLWTADRVIGSFSELYELIS